MVIIIIIIIIRVPAFIGDLAYIWTLASSQLHYRFLADRTNGRAYATVLRLSVVCDVMYCG